MIKVRAILCKSAIGKCGFPGGGLAINPYVGCAHNCAYCYARFIKRFTGHPEKWGSFVDARINIAEVLEQQMKSERYSKQQIYIGTVTDPYQPVEKVYGLTKKVLQVLVYHKNPISILTKSDLVLRDLDLLKKFKEIDVNFTVTTLDDKWGKLTEPESSTAKQRLKAMHKLSSAGIKVFAMMGPYWPVFTDAEALLKAFQEAGVSQVFTESLNTIGGNWTDVEAILKRYYPRHLADIRSTVMDKEKFYAFYSNEKKKLERLSEKYKLPIKVFFGQGHAAKFEK